MQTAEIKYPHRTRKRRNKNSLAECVWAMISLHIGVCPATAHRGEFAAPQSQASPGVASRYKVYGAGARTHGKQSENQNAL